MKKSEKIIAACLMIAVGILLIVLKDDMISILMSIIGVGLIVLGIMDLVSRQIPTGVVKLVCGVFIIVCGWVIVKAVLYVLAAVLLNIQKVLAKTLWQPTSVCRCLLRWSFLKKAKDSMILRK